MDMRRSFVTVLFILLPLLILAEVTMPFFKEESALKKMFRLSGYGQISYTYSDHTYPNNTFELRRAIVTARGDLGYGFNYKFTYALAATARILDCYLDWNSLSEFSLRVGQSKVPLTLENQIFPSTLETIYYPLVCQSLVALGASDVIGSNGGRDLGILAYGKLFPLNGERLVEYSLGIFNGSGINVKDKDNHKDISGGIYLCPIKGMKIGGSFYIGKATYILSGDTLSGTYERNRWSVGASFKSDKFTVRGEYVNGTDFNNSKYGAYLFGAIRLFKKHWEMLGEIDYYNKNKNNYTWQYTVGSNVYLNERNRLQLNYIRSADSKVEKSNCFVAQIQVGF